MSLRTTHVAALAALLLGLAAPARAQPGVSPGSAQAQPLDARMRQFLVALMDESGIARDAERLLPFFPRGGEWERVVTMHRGPGGDTVVVSRFRGEEIRRASKPGGPLCDSFHPGGGELGPMSGTLPYETREHPGEWWRIRGHRFVAPGRTTRSPVFVEWRQEDGRWVISAIGEEAYGGPAVVPASPAVARDPATEALRLPFPAGESFAEQKPWFTSREPILLDGRRYLQYGLPRRLQPGDVVRLGSLEGVGVYAEAAGVRAPEVLYIPVSAAGSFQPYQSGPLSWCSIIPTPGG